MDSVETTAGSGADGGAAAQDDLAVPEYRELGASALAGAQPAGVDPEYDVDEFARISAEVGKQLQVRKDQPTPDWSLVSELARQVLETRSKDLRVAIWMAVAHAALEGWEGLAKGLSVVIGLATGHEQSLHPRRKQRQINAIQVGIENLLIGRKQLDDGSVHYSGVLALQGDASAVRSAAAADAARQVARQCRFVKERFPDAAAQLSDLARVADDAAQRLRPAVVATAAAVAANPAEPVAAVANVVEQRPVHVPTASGPEPSVAVPSLGQATGADAVPVSAAQAATERAEVPVARAERAPPQPPAPLPPRATPANSRELRDTFRSVQAVLVNLATYRRGVSLADARAYREARAALWLEIEVLPEDAVMRPPEMEPLLKQLRGALDQGRHAEAVELAESNINRQTLFWLDLNRYVAEALEALGHADAARAVTEDLLFRIAELPGLEMLHYEGKIPFADDATRAWIAQSRRQAAPAAAGKPPVAGKPSAQTTLVVSMPARDATLLARAEQCRDVQLDAEAGLTLLWDAYRAALGGRDRMLARLDLARYCLDAGLVVIARDHVDAMHADVLAHRLDEWEPEIALRTEVLRFAIARVDGSHKREEERDAALADALRLIGLLDPAIALKCAMAG